MLKFLEVYGTAKATIAKLRHGSGNQAEVAGDFLWKGKLFFRTAGKGGVTAALASMSAGALVKQHKPRFIMATDGHEVQCRDLKADQRLDITSGS